MLRVALNSPHQFAWLQNVSRSSALSHVVHLAAFEDFWCVRASYGSNELHWNEKSVWRVTLCSSLRAVMSELSRPTVFVVVSMCSGHGLIYKLVTHSTLLYNSIICFCGLFQVCSPQLFLQLFHLGRYPTKRGLGTYCVFEVCCRQHSVDIQQYWMEEGSLGNILVGFVLDVYLYIQKC